MQLSKLLKRRPSSASSSKSKSMIINQDDVRNSNNAQLKTFTSRIPFLYKRENTAQINNNLAYKKII